MPNESLFEQGTVPMDILHQSTAGNSRYDNIQQLAKD